MYLNRSKWYVLVLRSQPSRGNSEPLTARFKILGKPLPIGNTLNMTHKKRKFFTIWWRANDFCPFSGAIWPRNINYNIISYDIPREKLHDSVERRAGHGLQPGKDSRFVFHSAEEPAPIFFLIKNCRYYHWF